MMGDGERPGEWLPVAEAARRLGLTDAGVRHRLRRGQLEQRRGNAGGLEVFVRGELAADADRQAELEALLAGQQEQLRHLRRELRHARAIGRERSERIKLLTGWLDEERQRVARLEHQAGPSAGPRPSVTFR
jgi:chromosome segregation ATPase